MMKSSDITRKIIKTRSTIRKKFQDLKESKHLLGVQTEEQFKSVTAPLQQLLQHVKQESPIGVKQEPIDKSISFKYEPMLEDEEEEEEPLASSSAYNVDTGATAYNVDTVQDPVEETTVLPPPRMSTPKRWNFMQSLRDSPNRDHIYGITLLKGDVLKLGDKTVKVNERNELTVGNETYRVTKGLYELLTSRRPKNYTEHDQQVYKKMLTVSRAHLKSNGQIKANSGEKYQQVIKKLFPPPPAFKGLQPSKFGASVYKYWNSADELVDRLRLLIASQEAGNTSHRNEIISIIEELKEEGIVE